MSRLKASLDHKRIRRLVWLVLTVFVLLGYSLQGVAGSVYYSMVMRAYGTVGSPPVFLEEGNVSGASTIYTNNTSAKVSVEAPLFDYVDNNDPDVDSSADIGMHSNFTAQQAGPDSIYDTLKEENTEGIEDYVDNISDVDSSPDVGTHSNFENQKAKDGNYDTLTESAEGITRDGVTQGQDISAIVTFSHTLGYSSGNNRLVIVAAGFENSAGDINIGSATYNGQSMTKVVQATTGGTGYAASVALFYILDSSLPSSSGSYSVVVTADSDPYRDLWACAVSYIGVKQEAPDDYDSDSSGSPTTMTSNLICDEDGSMLVQACVVGDIGSFSPSSGTTEVIEDSDINSASAVFNEKLGQDSGARDLGCTHGSMNRGAWVGACWAPASQDYELDIEVQFTNVIDFLPTEKLCIYTGTLGDEDLRVDYWNGTGWENLATDLTAYSCNEYTVSLTSTNFTIRFKGGTESSDTTQDQWQIDASLLRVEGGGDKEDAVDQQSNVDGPADVGTHSNFTAQQYGPDSINDTLTEENVDVFSNSTLLDDGFEGFPWDANWDAIASNWREDNSPVHSGSSSAWAADGYEGYFTCDNLDASDAVAIYVDFWFRKDDTESTDFTLYYYDGTSYDLIDELDNNGADDTWLRYTETVTDSQYFITNFRIRFDATLGFGENVWVDDVLIIKEFQSADNYQLDLEVQWTDLPYLLPNENLSIYSGTMGAEDINVDVWNGTGWETVFTDLSSGWNNASITGWLTSSNFTIRFKGGTETGDTSQDTWQIDVALIHIWNTAGENYELDLEVQWTNTVYTRTNETLCIKTGTFSGSENIQVKAWNNTASSWDWVMNLTASQWNNVSITSYLTSSTFTVQFLGGTETGDTTQDSWNIDATLLHIWGGASAWLSGWDKRVRITIDRNDIDTALSNFPILVYLSNSSSGRNNDDVSFIFDELQNDINRKKIAVTKSDGLTQCYIEIEKWDDVSEQAWLWVEVPNVSNTTDTDLYLYYDKDHADNPAYVDDTNTGNSVNVWDSSFKMVQHMRDNTTSSIVDSTSNDNDGTKTAAGEPAVTTSGKISDAQDFDGSNDYIDTVSSSSEMGIDSSNTMTVSAWVNPDVNGDHQMFVIIQPSTGSGHATDQVFFIADNNGDLEIGQWGGGSYDHTFSGISVDIGVWQHFVITYDGSTYRAYKNGNYEDSWTRAKNLNNAYVAFIGSSNAYAVHYFEGIIDEVRISNTTRNAAWIKASYESGRDDLLDFASEEGEGTGESTSEGTYDYVLKVVNKVADNWTVNLQVYDSSNIDRLSSLNISLHDGTSSNQIAVSGGSIVKSEGEPYNLPGGANSTIYISISNLQAITVGTSYLYVHLKLLVPDTSTYMLYVITFEIT